MTQLWARNKLNRLSTAWLLVVLFCGCQRPGMTGSEGVLTSHSEVVREDAVELSAEDVVELPAEDTVEPVVEVEDCGTWPEVAAAPIAEGVEAALAVRRGYRGIQALLNPPPKPRRKKKRRRKPSPPLTPPPVVTDAPGSPLLPNGVMSTEVRARSARLWTRVLRYGARARVRYRRGPRCPARWTEPIAVNPDRDHTVTLALDDLEPDQRYRYVVEVIGFGESAPGYFTTLPETTRPMRLAFGADLHTELNHLLMIDEVVASRPEVFLSLGDWPYQDFEPVSKSLAAYRWKYARSRSHREVHDWLRAMPIEGIWDDHEVLNDWDARDRRRDPARIAAGTRAWDEYFPVTGASEGVRYRRWRWGSGVEVFLLDGRGHRGENEAKDTEAKTMLGEAQRRWLLAGLRDSEATFKLIATTVPLVHATTRDDAWDGYRHEREQLMRFIREEGVEGVIFLTADQHWLGVHHLPQGMKEFQVGPLGVFTRTPRLGLPAWVVLQTPVLNFGLIDYHPGEDERLVFTAIGDGGGVLYREEIKAGTASLSVKTASPLMGWRLLGAHVFEGVGDREIPHAPPGAYQIEWRPLLAEMAAEPPERMEVAAGQRGAFESVTTGPKPTFIETFDGRGGLDRRRWQVVDQGGLKGPSRWRVEGGVVREFSDLRDQNLDWEVLGREGTLLWTSRARFRRGRLQVDVFVGDDDAFGVVYAMKDALHHYRVELDADRGAVRLLRVNGHQHALIAQAEGIEVPAQAWSRLIVERRGAAHTVRLNGAVILSARDGALKGGGVGLYAWGMKDIRFNDLVISPSP